MQADRSLGHCASSPEPAALIELRALQDMCRLRGHRIDAQHETVAVPRAGASALTLENAGMRLAIARLLARAGATPQLLLDLELTRDRSAPARARAAITEALHARVPSEALERIVLVASELLTHSVLRRDARSGDRLCLRAEASQVVVHVELEDPAPGAAIPPGVTDMADLRGLGLAIVHALSQRWGADLAEAGGTRFWAQLALDPLEPQGRYD